MTIASDSRYNRTYDIVDEESGLKFLSRRVPLSTLRADRSDIEYTTKVGDKLWTIAGNPGLYGNPQWWWVIADYNGIANVFGGNFDALPPGTKLRIPTKSRVTSFITKNEV